MPAETRIEKGQHGRHDGSGQCLLRRSDPAGCGQFPHQRLSLWPAIRPGVGAYQAVRGQGQQNRSKSSTRSERR